MRSTNVLCSTIDKMLTLVFYILYHLEVSGELRLKIVKKMCSMNEDILERYLA